MDVEGMFAESHDGSCPSSYPSVSPAAMPPWLDAVSIVEAELCLVTVYWIASIYCVYLIYSHLKRSINNYNYLKNQSMDLSIDLSDRSIDLSIHPSIHLGVRHIPSILNQSKLIYSIFSKTTGRRLKINDHPNCVHSSIGREYLAKL